MPVTLLNPEGLPQSEVYHQVAVGTGSRSIHIAGQVSVDADGNPVAPGDLAGQVAQAYRNVGVALAAAGATFADVVRLRIYIVDWDIEKMPQLMEGAGRVAEELQLVPAPISLIAVPVGFTAHELVEIEATAVLD